MTIEKGEPWGGPADEPEPQLVAGSDAELASIAAGQLETGLSGAVLLTGGDLLATLGVEGIRPPGERHAYPIDLAFAYLRSDPDGDERRALPFVAHATIAAAGNPVVSLLGRVLGHGPDISVSIMNAAWHGDLRFGPRAHPNDGLLDITEGQVGYRERREAAKRARSGSHLPHPALKTNRAANWEARFDQARSVCLDGQQVGRFIGVRVELVADACAVVA